VERELSGMVAAKCGRLNQSKPLKRRRNSRIQLYCRQYTSPLPLSNPRIIRSVMHYYLQYRYMIRVAERHVCCEPGRTKKCPTWNSRLPCAPSKTLWISTSFPLADIDVISRCANVLWPMVTITSPTGLGGNPTGFHCQKHVRGSSLSQARHKGPHSIFVNYNPKYKSNNFPMYSIYKFWYRKVLSKQNLT
jgi:hypothetical protein